MRALDDIPAARQAIYGNVLSTLQSSFPKENEQLRLELADLAYEDREDFDLAEQKKAILQRQTLGRRVKGTWRLIDKATNQVLDQQSKTIARVPYLTPRGTFIHNGNEDPMASQSRVLPGVYTRRKANGELESPVNVAPGTGRSFRIGLEPDTGVFRLQVDQGQIPLFPVLRALGIPDEELEQAVGKELYQRNLKVRSDGDPVIKAAAKLGLRRLVNSDLIPAEVLQRSLAEYQVDRGVMKATLGLDQDRLTPQALLAASVKLLKINRREADPDDRDDQANQQILAPEDIIAERVRKDAGGLLRGILWKATRTRNLKHVQGSALTPQLHSALLDSGLASAVSEINPVELLDQQVRITRMGEGGIGDPGAIPDESRSQHPSQQGFIDTIFTPESNSIGVDMRAASGTVKGSDGRLYSKLINVRTGKQELKAAADLRGKVLAFPMELDDPNNDVVTAVVNGQIRQVKRKEVDYTLEQPENAFSAISNLVPGFSGMKGGRLIMGARMVKQALPLSQGEAPLVQSADGSGESFERRVGLRSGVVQAVGEGTVVSPRAGGDGARPAQARSRTARFEGSRSSSRKGVVLAHPPQRLSCSESRRQARPRFVLNAERFLASKPWRGSG